MADNAPETSVRQIAQSDEYPTSLGQCMPARGHLAPCQNIYVDDRSTTATEDGSRSPTSYQSPSLTDKSPTAGRFSPLPESTWSHHGEKEVLSAYNCTHPGLVTTNDQIEVAQQEPKARKRKRWIIFAVALIILILGAALGAGLGLGLKKKDGNAEMPPLSPVPTTPTTPVKPGDSGSSDYLIGGALNPAYYSTRGAFNGSGIALANQRFTSSTSPWGVTVLYYQHHTGQIRNMILQVNGSWTEVQTVVADDARNSTPISVVSYERNQTATWHVFYVDKENMLRQKTNSNRTSKWIEGPLTNERLRVFDGNHVGLQACWYGSYYGNTGARARPTRGSGMILWYATDNSTFQEYTWEESTDDPSFDNWVNMEANWNEHNGHAGVGCYTWETGPILYTMMLNQRNEIETFWADDNSNESAWAIAQGGTIKGLHPSTSLGYTNALFAQRADGRLQGYEYVWGAENTSVNTAVSSSSYRGLTIDGTGADVVLNGSHLSVTALPSLSGGSDLTVFAQVDGNDIISYRRDVKGGPWSMQKLPIPDT
ncbi:Hypothetical protein D9617_2g059740 [Elsinoe fawcettii]|nr:Hypothetical protein D9617_2g059740 [Elsinoe fawcettii]